MDAFAAGVPVVTADGRFMRGRQTAAMLRMMGLAQLVANDSEDYVRLALAVAAIATGTSNCAGSSRRAAQSSSAGTTVSSLSRRRSSRSGEAPR
jgi:predicted O-linked N-acetylglucosamine transferase (SPINDLY family)